MSLALWVGWSCNGITGIDNWELCYSPASMPCYCWESGELTGQRHHAVM